MRAPTAKIRVFRPHALALAFATVLAGSASTPIALAEDREDPLALLYGDEETVSIATGSKKPLRLAPSVASVITAEDIRATGAQSLDDVLQAVPGVHVSLSKRYSSLISIRGIHTDLNPQVLLLIDGFPVTELFTGGRFPTYRLPVHSIERVEVIRGPGSAIYGADAFAGVINVITKTPADISRLEAGVSVGSFDTKSTWMQSSGAWLGWDLGLSAEALSSDGDSNRIIAQDLQSSLDRLVGSRASEAPGPAQTHHDVLNYKLQGARKYWNLALQGWHQDKAGVGPGIADVLDPKGTQDAEQYLVEIGFDSEDFFDNWQLGARYNYLHGEQESFYAIFPAGAILPIGADGNLNFTDSNSRWITFTEGFIGNPGGVDRNHAFEAVAYYDGFPEHRLRLAAGAKSQELDTFESKNFGPGVLTGTTEIVDGTLTDVSNSAFVYMPDQERTVRHLSLQDEWSIYKDWELTAGIRYDDYSDFGTTVNPRLALVWQTSYAITSKLLYGRAFRAPSFSEQFAINNPVILGNPEVDPEEIDTVEMSFDYRPSYDLHARLNLFHYSIEGLIDYVDEDGLTGGTSRAQNLLDQHGYGIEMEVTWRPIESLSVAANYSWQHSENDATGQTVADAPEKIFYLDGRWQMSPAWASSMQVHHVADRNRALGDVRSQIADYTLVNITLFSDKLTRHFDLRASVKNIFDEDAREPSLGPEPAIPLDHPLEGRKYLLEAIFRL